MGSVGQVTGQVASAHFSSSSTSPIKKKEQKFFNFSYSTEDLKEVYKSTGEVGPTIKNAEALETKMEAGNPFKKGKLAGTRAFNAMDALENFDWTTGTFLNLTSKS